MRKIFVIFSFLIILTSCGNKQINNEVQVSSLKDFTPEQLGKIKLNEKDGDRILIDD